MSDLEVSQSDYITKQQIIDVCAKDLNSFGSLILEDDVMEYEFPEFYITLWSFFLKVLFDLKSKAIIEKVFRFALGLPRGHAKTTILKLLVCYAVIHKLVDFVLIVCATESLATNFLADVHTMLTSDNVKRMYGDWSKGKIKDNEEVKSSFFLGREVNIVRFGAESALRGLNKSNKRPDFIVLDDVQTRENDASEIERQKLLLWITGTLVKARSPKGCAIFYIGNMYSDECILNKLHKSEQWRSLISGAILSDGKCLWEELYSIEMLLDEYKADASLGMGNVWFAEVQNDPYGGDCDLIPEGELPDTPDYVVDARPMFKFIVIDPAGRKKTSDNTGISVHSIYEGQVCGIEYADGEILDPKQTIEKAFALAIEYNAVNIIIENVAYQDTLIFWFEEYMQLFPNISLNIIGISPKQLSKVSRLREFIKELLAKDYYFTSQEAKDNFLFEARLWKAINKNNLDDVMDTCAYGLMVKNSYLNQLVHYYDLNQEQIGYLNVVGKNTGIDNYRRYTQ